MSPMQKNILNASLEINRPSITFLVMLILSCIINSLAKAEENSKEQSNGTPWNPVQSDQWVATDNLLRELPTIKEVGKTRQNKYIACFYFLWNGRHGEAGPYNISQILKDYPEAKDDPNSPLWGALGVPHHWAESIFGYYVGEDEYVLRKHAQMLGDAGVDVICFDVTNQLTYPESYRPLFKVFSEMQKAGNKVPKVAFLCPFWAPNKVVRELWRDVYSQNFYPDVWFYWKGKPLILADPDFLSHGLNLNSEGCVPIQLEKGFVLSQKFSVDSAFSKIYLNSPTWQDQNSSVNITIRDETGKVIESRYNFPVTDCHAYAINFDNPLPAGIYTVELQKGKGDRVGWWAHNINEGNYEEEANNAYKVKSVHWLEAKQNDKVVNNVFLLNISLYDEETEKILDFFTFRPPQPDYFIGQTKPNQWSWLEVYPQHEFINDKGELEEISVGVAQNAVEGKLGVLSNPCSYGRSYHNGSEPLPQNCDYTGKNFQEQWDRALKLDPQIIFVTGWNEWIAGRFDSTAPFHGATPVSFVDQYNEEFSRDCEPMKGGHEDAYYYQFISNVRRFKGVSQTQQVKPQSIKIDGKFGDWSLVEPKFYDTISDPACRDCRGWGKDVRYVNNTGRNDFIQSQVSYDEENIYFYVKTQNEIKGDFTSPNWISLLLDVDENAKTGVKGNDFLVVSNGQTFVLTKATNNVIDFETARKVEFSIVGKEIEIAIPRDYLNLKEEKPVFRFKWIDGIDISNSWSVFTTDGDAAPNDRYYYRYNAGK